MRKSGELGRLKAFPVTNPYRARENFSLNRTFYYYGYITLLYAKNSNNNDIFNLIGLSHIIYLIYQLVYLTKELFFVNI